MDGIKTLFLQLATIKTDLQVGACFKIFQPSYAHCGCIGWYQLIFKGCSAWRIVKPIQHRYEILELSSGKNIGRNAAADDELQERVVGLLVEYLFAF